MDTVESASIKQLSPEAAKAYREQLYQEAQFKVEARKYLREFCQVFINRSMSGPTRFKTMLLNSAALIG